MTEISQASQPRPERTKFQWLVLGLFLLTMGLAALTCILIMVEQPWKQVTICNQSNSPNSLLLPLGANPTGMGSCTTTPAKEASPFLNLAINSMVGSGSVLIAISVVALVKHKYARKSGIAG